MTLPEFPNHLIDAVTKAEAGLRFEEGGCFAMTLALSENLRALGADVTPALMEGPDHAVVLMNGAPGTWADHMGYQNREIRTRPTDEAGLREAASACGWSEADFESDLAWARDVIDLAISMTDDAPRP